MKKIVFLIVVFLLLDGCKSVPLSGRRQMALIPSSQLNTMSYQSYSDVMSSSNVVTRTEDARMVDRVGQKIAASVEKYLNDNGMGDRVKGFQWEFNLIDEDVINAWAMPGGKVAFYTGILPVCQNEAGVAVVMGHEVAHAIAQHGNERMTHGLAQQLGGMSLQVALRDRPQATQNLFLQSYGAATTVGAMLPFSRKHESEADELGLYFMAMAGYDPREAPKFWERMQSASSGRGQAPPEFMSTHPSHDRRIRDLNANMPKALEYYNARR